MPKVYKLRNAFTLNATGAKVNVIASPAFKQEINRHQQYFNFDFSNMLKDFIVYKFTVAEQPGFIQALVAFRATQVCLIVPTWKLTGITESLHLYMEIQEKLLLPFAVNILWIMAWMAI